MSDAVDDRAVVERVVGGHAGWVFAAVRRRVRDAALAEDVTQAVFMLFWRKRPAVGEEGKEGKLAGWLYRAVRYCSANALRLGVRAYALCSWGVCWVWIAVVDLSCEGRPHCGALAQGTIR